MRKNIIIYMWCLLLAALLLLLLRETWTVVVEHILVPDFKSFKWSLLSWPNVFKHFNLGLYWWFMTGMTIYPLLRKCLSRRSLFFNSWFNSIETQAHEFSHTLVSFLTGRRIHSMHIEENTGQIVTSGSNWNRPFVSLAPYTLPFLSYIGLALRSLIAWQNIWFYDILIGLTLGFHIICFVRDTHISQTDINRFSTIWFPGFYIAVWTVFNFNVIMVTFWSSKNFFTALWWVLQHLVVW